MKHPRILLWARGQGKTTECLKTLRKDKDALLFVPNEMIAIHLRNNNEDIKNRILSARSKKSFLGLPQFKAIIDEPDYIPDEILERIEDHFQIILIAGSLGKSYDQKDAWFRKKLELCNYEVRHFMDSLKRNALQKRLTKEMFEREIIMKFK